MKKTFYGLLIAFAMLLISCNADILTEDIPQYTGDPSRLNTSELFKGDAPRNIYASKSVYQDVVKVTFDSVPGADYYEIYRAKLPRDQRTYDPETLEWLKNDTSIPDNGGKEIIFEDKPARAEKDSYYYLYKVKAASMYNSSNDIFEGEFSSVVEGWTLSPPQNLVTSQGEYKDRINLSWERIDNVRGYNVYKLNTAGIWEQVNDGIIASPVTEDTIEWSYTGLSDAELGKDVYFSVSAFSAGDEESSTSGVRNGYTFVEGAPNAPKGLTASAADYTDKIVISWEKPIGDDSGPERGYIWEIYRSTKNTDDVKIFEFNAYGLESGGNIELKDGKYVYTDTNNLKEGTEYTYTVRAIGKMENEEVQGTFIDLIGPSSRANGCIMSSPGKVSISVSYPEAENLGSFDITVEAPPIGYSEDKNWTYVLYGRSNDGTSAGGWNAIMTSGVSQYRAVMHVDYAEYPYNEFAVTLRDLLAQETSIGNAVLLVADSIDLEGLRIMSNRYNDKLTANSNGVYPVWLSIDGYERIKEIDLRVNNGEPVKISMKDLENEDFALSQYSPDEPFEKYTYSVKAYSYFGRTTSWGTNETAYGAVTGEKFIKLFEAYAMKPWEFVEHADFPENLKNKWISNEIHVMIDKHGTGSLGDAETASEFHGGKITYHSGMGDGFTGTVTFTYSDFGELEGIYSNGTYSMVNVNMSGNGNTVTGVMSVSGMYPASVDFSSLKVSNYAFSGNYYVTQDNGSGRAAVAATVN